MKDVRSLYPENWIVKCVFILVAVKVFLFVFIKAFFDVVANIRNILNIENDCVFF